MFPATQSYVEHGDILNEKASFNQLPGKIEIQGRGNFENLLSVYL